jgi:hypothetical protein
MRAGTLLLAAMAVVAWGQGDELNVDHPAIQYTTRPLADPVAELNRKVLAGKLQLRFDDQRGYLPAILEALDIPVESQMAVFSKTSVQSMRISPRHPRAVYFNDSVAVGWVPRGTIELTALDPRQGVVFYSVDQRKWTNEGGRSEIFQRRTDCLHCHITASTGGVPGLLARSVFTRSDGTPMRVPRGIDTDLRTPFEKLWGGWYVSGESTAHHLGAVERQYDPNLYPSPGSDIVALLVFQHQRRVTNLLVEAGWRARVGSSRLPETIRELGDALTFAGELPLPEKVRGSSGFAEKFAARGPLRHFDLDRRLMRDPVSYMIYSPAFDALPPEVRDGVYRRIWAVLKERASEEARRDVVAILRETKPGLPGYFR